MELSSLLLQPFFPAALEDKDVSELRSSRKRRATSRLALQLWLLQ